VAGRPIGRACIGMLRLPSMTGKQKQQAKNYDKWNSNGRASD
jgi:hypothetical protein